MGIQAEIEFDPQQAAKMETEEIPKLQNRTSQDSTLSGSTDASSGASSPSSHNKNTYGDSDLSELPCTLQLITKERREESKVMCDGVYIASTQFGDGAFAGKDFEPGEAIEWGIIRRLPAGFKGEQFPFCFTWSEDRTVWGMGSGTATFYNTSLDSNTKMIRFFEEDRFEIYATKPIKRGEQLLHKYRSLKWRTCFAEMNDILEAEEGEA